MSTTPATVCGSAAWTAHVEALDITATPVKSSRIASRNYVPVVKNFWILQFAINGVVLPLDAIEDAIVRTDTRKAAVAAADEAISIAREVILESRWETIEDNDLLQAVGLPV